MGLSGDSLENERYDIAGAGKSRSQPVDILSHEITTIGHSDVFQNSGCEARDNSVVKLRLFSRADFGSEIIDICCPNNLQVQGRERIMSAPRHAWIQDEELAKAVG